MDEPRVRNRISMDQATHNKIVSFIWGVADDVLRDLFKRGKYPDVILPDVRHPAHRLGARLRFPLASRDKIHV